ncbi:hypothetical protein EDD21DRAFT_420191 [Dissophora ornata]|nr:hypothetical protein EDD21DRAFT_420191 [Dissophora ornata]
MSYLSNFLATGNLAAGNRIRRRGRNAELLPFLGPFPWHPSWFFLRGVKDKNCLAINQTADVYCLSAILGSLGVSQTLVPARGQKTVEVQLDDSIVGHCSVEETKPARMMRPVKYFANGKINMVGSFERVYMEMDCMDDEICPCENTHQELAPTSIPSAIANLMPFFEFNESPRNIYRCQKGGRQAIGTLATSIKHRIVNKMSSHERGFGYGAIYKSEIVDLGDFRIRGEPVLHHFGLGLKAPRSWRGKLDKDGLLCISVTLQDGDPICSYIDGTTGKTSIKKYKGMEEGIVDKVCLLGSDLRDMELRKIHIKFCITRSSISSRRVTDRRPDVIVKPHTVRSRMTIGMFVESLLKTARYNYHGIEPMYSGITGEESKLDIYLQVAY